jgi:hypothetical protein
LKARFHSSGVCWPPRCCITAGLFMIW